MEELYCQLYKFTSLKYRGSFVFRTGTDGRTELEGIAYDGGRLMAENHDGETVRLRDLWHVRDHLGSVRAVVDISEDGGAADSETRILEESDYMAFGTRFSPYPGAPAMSGNRYRYSGREDQSFAGLPYIDYGARMYDPYAARWNATDPMAAKYPSTSPYVFCANDSVNFIDEKGESVVVYIETTGLGHAWIGTGNGENTTVYSYGRYDHTNKGNVLSNGPGV